MQEEHLNEIMAILFSLSLKYTKSSLISGRLPNGFLQQPEVVQVELVERVSCPNEKVTHVEEQLGEPESPRCVTVRDDRWLQIWQRKWI